MGISIHYFGLLKKNVDASDVILLSKDFADIHSWSTQLVDNGIKIFPHASCEPLIFIFSGKNLLKTSIKTQYAPIDIHLKILELLRIMKNKFSKLEIDDESGEWYNILNKDVKFPDLDNYSNILLRKFDSITSIDYPESETWFWKSNMNLKNKLNFPYLLHWIIDDYIRIKQNNISLIYFLEILDIEYPRSFEVEKKDISSCIIILLEGWVKMIVDPNITPQKRSVFTWALAANINWFWGGYFNAKHKAAFECGQRLQAGRKDLQTDIGTMKFVFALLKFIGIGEKYIKENLA